MALADLMRLVCMIEAAILVCTCVYCMLGGPMAYDQRMRFAGLALIGVIVVWGQLDSWGNPGNLRMPLLAIAIALTIAGNAKFLARRRKADRE